ncbi:hypothetical protein E2C01_042574 [Portunus trituberculatus]|uniref:Uncharacterized protein n=1 Tax=Portunus trituberculatus TaxID=210409 RepID=A0A5B7FMS2_PORTR|nr:hypothetical protein [Portunus trituberculatus]
MSEWDKGQGMPWCPSSPASGRKQHDRDPLEGNTKKVAQTQENDSASEDLSNWDCEIGKDELFPFNVIKKGEDIHKS